MFVEKMRYLLLQPKLLKAFSDEALNITVYTINLSLLAPLCGDMPNKVWSCKDVTYDQLCVFGCIGLRHIPSYEKSKLDAKTQYMF